MMNHNADVPIPAWLLSKLLTAQASSAAHYKVCGLTQDSSNNMQSYPGDSFGKVVAWLWNSGQKEYCASLITEYLAQMRVHNPNIPAEGERLTWNELRVGLSSSTSHRLEPDECAAMLSYLNETVPGLYEHGPSIINLP